MYSSSTDPSAVDVLTAAGRGGLVGRRPDGATFGLATGTDGRVRPTRADSVRLLFKPSPADPTMRTQGGEIFLDDEGHRLTSDWNGLTAGPVPTKIDPRTVIKSAFKLEDAGPGCVRLASVGQAGTYLHGDGPDGLTFAPEADTALRFCVPDAPKPAPELRVPYSVKVKDSGVGADGSARPVLVSDPAAALRFVLVSSAELDKTGAVSTGDLVRVALLGAETRVLVRSGEGSALAVLSPDKVSNPELGVWSVSIQPAGFSLNAPGGAGVADDLSISDQADPAVFRHADPEPDTLPDDFDATMRRKPASWRTLLCLDGNCSPKKMAIVVMLVILAFSLFALL